MSSALDKHTGKLSGGVAKSRAAEYGRLIRPVQFPGRRSNK
jgi:hypothetical protein